MQKNHYSMLTSQEMTEVVAHVKKLHQADNFAQQTPINKGRVCYDFVKGNTLSAAEMEELEAADKIPVQSTDALNKIAAIIGMLSQTAKDGVVVGNSSEDAASAELRTRILKDYIEKLSSIEMAEIQVAQDSLVTGVPGFLWLEPFDPRDPSEKGIYVRAMPWDSVIPDAAWRCGSMRDMRRIHRHMQLSTEDVVAQGFVGAKGLEPWQVKQMEQAAYNVTNINGVSDYQNARNGETYTSAGLLNVVETLEWRNMEWTVAFDQFGNSDPIPPEWDEATIQQFIDMNPDIGLRKENERILWSTIWTTSGLLLDYGPHWLQIKEFPCEPFVLANIDGAWSGLIEHVIDTIKAMTYAKTEHLQGIRSVNNLLWKMKEGAVPDRAEFEDQRKTAGGTIVVKQDANLDDVNPVANQRENQAFLDWFNLNSDVLDRQTVERNFEGGAQASQESSRAIGARIAQTLNKLQFFLKGYNPMRMGIRRKAIKALPFCFPNEKVLRLMDPSNGNAPQETTVNQPVEYDINGEPMRRINRLDLGDFDFTFTDADTSINGKAIERDIMNDFLKFSTNMPPEMVIPAAKAYPSTAVQQYGAELEAMKQQQMNAPPPPPQPKVSLSISSADIGTDATLTVMRDQGLLPAEPEQVAPEQMEEMEDQQMAPEMDPMMMEQMGEMPEPTEMEM